MAVKPTLVILAAGKGSRFGGVKQLEGIGPDNEKIIDYSVFDAARAGFGKAVFVIKEDAREDFDKAFSALRERMEVEYSFQDEPEPPREKPWGTGDALLTVREMVREPFAMINADDYYGQSAFSSAAAFLRERGADSREYGMLGYALRDTLSAHGSVSRGMCNVREDQRLESILEHTHIAYDDGSIVSTIDDDSAVTLTGDEPVSMNFWLLTPTIFPYLEVGRDAFMAEFGDSTSAEFVLPNLIGELLQRGEVSVSVLRHTDTWIGLTNPEDAARASATMQSLHEKGVYPSPLWPEE